MSKTYFEISSWL